MIHARFGVLRDGSLDTRDYFAIIIKEPRRLVVRVRRDILSMRLCKRDGVGLSRKRTIPVGSSHRQRFAHISCYRRVGVRGGILKGIFTLPVGFDDHCHLRSVMLPSSSVSVAVSAAPTFG